jgi:hypothetical protein
MRAQLLLSPLELGCLPAVVVDHLTPVLTQPQLPLPLQGPAQMLAQH